MPAKTPSPTVCARCGACFSATAVPGGGCPRCLLERGLEWSEPESVSGHAAEPWALERVQRTFPELVVDGLIGRGGMGAVYSARQPALDRSVALKLMSPQLAADPTFSRRFQREARALAKLDHPNVVRVHDHGCRDGLHFLIMERVEGATLRELLDPGELTAAHALGIVRQLCDALEHAHERGVVHRDVKPENVLVDASGRVKVADFGLARLVERTATQTRLTGSGQLMGTPHYMAPEQVERSDSLDHRADIYSLGVVFYEMLTGGLPLGRFDEPSRGRSVDVRLDPVVLRALQKDPDARYQSVSELRFEVDSLGHELEPAALRFRSFTPGLSHAPWSATRARWARNACWTTVALLLVTGSVLIALQAGSLRRELRSGAIDVAAPNAARQLDGPVLSIVLGLVGMAASVGLGRKLDSWIRVRATRPRRVRLALSRDIGLGRGPDGEPALILPRWLVELLFVLMVLSGLVFIGVFTSAALEAARDGRWDAAESALLWLGGKLPAGLVVLHLLRGLVRKADGRGFHGPDHTPAWLLWSARGVLLAALVAFVAGTDLERSARGVPNPQGDVWEAVACLVGAAAFFVVGRADLRNATVRPR